MYFELMPMDWYKRRDPDKDKKEIKKVHVENFQKIDGFKCEMFVEMECGIVLQLNAYAQVNDITGKWTVHGMNETGISVLARLIEE